MLSLRSDDSHGGCIGCLDAILVARETKEELCMPCQPWMGWSEAVGWGNHVAGMRLEDGAQIPWLSRLVILSETEVQDAVVSRRIQVGLLRHFMPMIRSATMTG